MTLPGIAGYILSIGMAVDANVLIFERTREELRANKTLYRAVESGFFRAFSSILDSNITTLIACAAMFWFGSGLVKGFAVTLSIGVLISMFTAVTCTRTLLMLLVLGVPKLRQRPELFCPNLPAATVK
jgi:preprotein translocase subunit SecD